ncbi:TetR/AcrR family transcriptional regulator C-terminal domain-containing protein [Lacicoccus alkaliphilus]|uniref:Transcriptional regulator, TetR family n=1 Tax=Lacicoccus alkaliphilus DSM 16010 TaxID=1123231 RepID=A0A1M7ASG3_9BACL|nr:TetR/AcrR family transcriptional regulator C-terminal domain-containing protein [Salinicoccus alkaliphilus]SHL45688.1 transcriptional regulator, TetR family [Salinicoccus alkaliphilus DSM 16010]
MTEQKNARPLLIESFKMLLPQYPFEKITVQMIAENAGVKRATFYNHFLDKYELFSVILEEELFQAIHTMMEADMERESLKMIFSYFEKNRDFYAQAFQVHGQNSFEAVLRDKMQLFYNKVYDKHGLNLDENLSALTQTVVEMYHASGLVYILEKWITEEPATPAGEVFEAYVYLISNSILDLTSDG